MLNIQLVSPMFALVFLTFFTGLILFVRRVSAAKNKQLDPKRFKTFSIQEAPAHVLQAERHFINLFEVPVLFYIACVVIIALNIESKELLYLAWSFVAFRYIHAGIHLWPNKLYPRMVSFFLGFITVLAMWVMILFKTL